jgi:predicted kinase
MQALCRGGEREFMASERWSADRLDTRIRQGRLDAMQARAVAAALARWQDAAPPPGGADATDLARLAERVATASARVAARFEDACIASDARRRLARALMADRDRFVARQSDAVVRRVHGAFAPERVFVDAAGFVHVEEPASAQAGDPAADVARMAAALRRAGRDDLADRFVAAYAQCADDFGVYRTLAFHESLTAIERAAEVTDAADAVRWLAQSRPAPCGVRPQLVAVGGPRASGKSTVAARLASELGAPLVSVHALRECPADEWSATLALVDRARPVLDAGRPVVVDATFAAHAQRRILARLARERGAPFLFAECKAAEGARARRIAMRASGSGAESPEWESVRDLEGGIHVVIDTTRPVARGMARVARILPGVVARLVA